MTKRNIGAPAPCDVHVANLSVFIGRFQPFHNGHLSVLRRALATTDTVLILVGSADQPRDYFNPFSFDERKAMIESCLPDGARERVLVLPLLDWTYNNAQWVTEVQVAVKEALDFFELDEWAKIALIGHSKDHSSYYLKMFPQWASIETANFEGVSATPIREALFDRSESGTLGPDMLPAPVEEQIAAFRNTPDYAHLIDEFEFIRAYKKQFAGLPYPPIFQTVDACVVQSGHVLLVERRGRPGKGLWALPGGFVNAGEFIDTAVYRELREETKIKVPEAVLRGCTIYNRRFDDPHRSARGRTITDAFLIKLPDSVEFPKVKGSDDAAKARWFPLADVVRSMMFEDHFHIVANLTARL